jgi:hypothetical protein
MKNTSAGIAILSVLLIVSFGLLAIAGLGEIIWCAKTNQNALYKEWQAFYLAEAGLERAKATLKAFPLRYTDVNEPADLPEGLVAQAIGYTENLNTGGFKVVRVKNKNEVYVFGWSGRGPARGRAFIKATFETYPFRITKWERI